MIKIDIEMPRSCYVCRFKQNVYMTVCTCLLYEYLRGFYDEETYKYKRPKWCPLKEVKEDSNDSSRAY